jgi:hypothetical protein
MIDNSRCVLFDSGNIYCTANAHKALTSDDIAKAIARHMSGDWGEVCEDDRKENELSLREGFRLMSIYRAKDGTKFWVITEWDRSATTILLPEDY